MRRWHSSWPHAPVCTPTQTSLRAICCDVSASTETTRQTYWTFFVNCVKTVTPQLIITQVTMQMKALMATIALLCLSSTVLAHDIYTNLRDRNGNPCCGGEDCMPVEATVLPDGNYYLPASGEIIPADMATPSPDNRFHRCTYPHLAPIANEFDRWPAWKSIPETRCFFAPMHST